jgi:hypothetical protein
MKLPKIKYRIIPDVCSGWEVQSKRWWFPFWIQCSDLNGLITNTHKSIEDAKRFIDEKIEQEKPISSKAIHYNPHLDKL